MAYFSFFVEGEKKVYGVQSKLTTVLQCHYSNNVIVHLFNFPGIKDSISLCCRVFLVLVSV